MQEDVINPNYSLGRDRPEDVDVRFTPNSDRERTSANGDVCFTPESRRVQRTSSCLLWANSGTKCVTPITTPVTHNTDGRHWPGILTLCCP